MKTGSLDDVLFEGTRPLSEIEKDAPSAEEIETKLPPKMKDQAKVWTTLAGVNKKPAPQVDADEKVKYEEARLKRLREQLEVKA